MFTLNLLGLFLLLSSSGRAASEVMCRWTQFQMGQLNDLSILILSDMVSSSSGHFPSECLKKDKVERLFPENLYQTTEREDVVALRTFEQVAQIFNSSLAPLSWDKDKLRLFTNYIYRQIKKLNGCISAERAASVQRDSTVISSLQTFYEQLSVLLKEKEYSACAWEKVRQEVRSNLLSFKKFIEREE